MEVNISRTASEAAASPRAPGGAAPTTRSFDGGLLGVVMRFSWKLSFRPSGGICVPTVFEPQIPPLGLKSSVGMTKLKDLYGAPKGAPLQNNFAIDFLSSFEVVTD